MANSSKHGLVLLSTETSFMDRWYLRTVVRGSAMHGELAYTEEAEKSRQPVSQSITSE